MKIKKLILNILAIIISIVIIQCSGIENVEYKFKNDLGIYINKEINIDDGENITTTDNNEIIFTKDERKVEIEKYSIYFSDNVYLKNNLWVNCDENRNPTKIAGIIDIKEERETITIKFRLYDLSPLGGVKSINKENVNIEQNNQKYPFLSGTVLDYSGGTFIPFLGWPPLLIEKSKFNSILENLNSEEMKHILTDNYETDLPEIIKWARFEGIFRYQLEMRKDRKNKNYLTAYYIQKEKYSDFFLKEDITEDERENLIKIINSIKTPTYSDYTYDYQNYYILREDNLYDNFKIPEEELDKIREILYNSGFKSCLEWEITFKRLGNNGDVFDINKPFNIKFDNEICINFENVLFISPKN